MRQDPINAGMIQARKNIIKSDQSLSKIGGMIKNVSFIKDDIRRRDYIESIFNLCRTSESVDKYISDCVGFINESIGPEHDLLGGSFLSQLLPLSESISTASVIIKGLEDDDIRRKAINILEQNRLCDRVLNNHEKLHNRFYIDSSLNAYTISKDINGICNTVLSSIGSYSIPGKSKVSISLDEISYILQKNGIGYSEDIIVETVTDYFLLKENITGYDVASALYDNPSIHESNKVKDLISKLKKKPDKEFYDKNIDEIILDCKKNTNVDEKLLRKAIHAIYAKSPDDIMRETPNILGFFRSLLIFGSFGVNIVLGLILIATDYYIDMSLNRKQTDKIYKYYKKEKEKAKDALNRSKDKEEINKLNEYIKALDKCISKVEDYKTSLYTTKEYITQSKEESTILSARNYITLDEFKLFKFDNLITRAIDAGKNIKNKIEDIFRSNGKDKPKVNIFSKKTKTKGNLFALGDIEQEIKDYVAEAYITDKGIFDVIAATLEISENCDLEYIDCIRNTICEFYNNEYSDIVFFTNTTEDEVQFHMCSKETILLDENSKDLIDNIINPSDMVMMESLMVISNLLNRIDMADMKSFYRDIRMSENVSSSSLCDIAEMSIIAGVDNIFGNVDNWNHIVEMHKIKNTSIDGIIENTKLMSYNLEKCNSNYPLELQTESCEIIRCIIDEGLDFSGLKVAVQGMKSKVKNLGAKEKEISRDIDVATNALTKSIQTALTNDRREAIIKGSVIPSFSKCIKTAIALGGVSIVFDPTMAAITLIGGLGASKYLNDKERMLLLDEVEVELKVVEKELSIAENANDMKKYRQLLSYQRKLKKEAFKLKYKLSRITSRNYLTRKDENE